MAVRSFKGRVTEAVFRGQCPKGFPADFFKVTRRKLSALDAAETIEDLRVPPANHSEALGGNRIGQHSVRVNDQFGLRFFWTDMGPEDVEFVDYH